VNEEYAERPRVQSARIHNDDREKSSFKSPIRRSRYLNRPKSSSVHRSSPSVKHFFIFFYFFIFIF